MTATLAPHRHVEPPEKMRSLPRDARGFLIPWFVHIGDDGVPDFRVIRRGGIERAHRNRTCWLCGDTMGVHVSYVIGPMCAINRTSAEPPAHRDCARYAAQVCPFLVKPRMKRNESDYEEERDLPPGTVAPTGHMIRRNPGCCAVWTTRTIRTFRVATGGHLYNIGDPAGVEWYAEGRAATRAEVLASIDSGMPLLLDGVRQERDDSERILAFAELLRRTAAASALLPPGDDDIAMLAEGKALEDLRDVLSDPTLLGAA